MSLVVAWPRPGEQRRQRPARGMDREAEDQLGSSEHGARAVEKDAAGVECQGGGVAVEETRMVEGRAHGGHQSPRAGVHRKDMDLPGARWTVGRRREETSFGIERE